LRIAYFANNQLGARIGAYLREQGETIVALVIHPPGRRRFGEEILAACDVEPSHVFDGSRLGEVAVQDALGLTGAEIAVSVLFGYLLRRPVLDLFPRGGVNLHPGYLPYNRGAYPNVWSIVDGTPAGATLHLMDEGVDTGDILAQTRVAVSAWDTGETLYRKLEIACFELFRTSWPLVRGGRLRPMPQEGPGSVHRVADVEKIDAIDLDATYTARCLIDILRARAFPPHRGAYFCAAGRKVFVEVKLIEAGEEE
jgi:methionyl-tRNA formyltransferase